MAVTQYIGSRYVPIFADPIEWSSAKEYEPLTIVIHEGNSYTAKHFVPVGIDIANGEYWALTGNYNAQVEQYRRETAAAKATADNAQTDIDTLLPKVDFSAEESVKKYIDDSVAEVQTDIDTLLPKTDFSAENTVSNVITTSIKKNSGISYVGNYGANENDATVDWQSIIDAMAEVTNTIDFGCGNWIINNSVTFPQNISQIVGNGCLIKTTNPVNTLFTIASASLDDNVTPFVMNGIRFDGQFNVNTLCDYLNGNTMHVFNCTFKRFNSIALNCSVLGAFISNCMFSNTRDTNRGIGVRATTDNFILNCKFFYIEKGIDFHSGHVANCYFYTYNPNSETFAITRSDGLLQYLECSGCEFDGIVHAIGSPQNCIVKGNSFIYTEADLNSDYDYSVFHALGENIPQIIFDDNFFSATWTGISATVKTFTYPNPNGNNQIRNYTSKGNVINHLEKYNTAVLGKLQLLCGWVNQYLSGNYNTDGASAAPNAYVATEIKSDDSIYNFNNATLQIEVPFLLCNYNHSSNGISSLIQLSNLNHSGARIHVYKDATNRVFYLTCEPLQISKIAADGCAFNMPLIANTSQIDTSGMVITNAINLAS